MERSDRRHRRSMNNYNSLIKLANPKCSNVKSQQDLSDSCRQLCCLCNRRCDKCISDGRTIAKFGPQIKSSFKRNYLNCASMLLLVLTLIASIALAQQPNGSILKDSIISNAPTTIASTNVDDIDTLVKNAFDEQPTTSAPRVSPSTSSTPTTIDNSSNNGDNGTTISPFITNFEKPSGGAFATMRNDSREHVLEVVRQAHQNLLDAEIVTNKTRAFLSCETGQMIVKLNFTEPFSGVAYADYDRSSPCRLYGTGANYYELRLPLKGCGTRQEAPRLFINNLIVRFHRTLELEEDEIKTLVCRYPPPQAPTPGPPPRGPPAKIVDIPPEPAKLVRYEPLFMVAGLLFFTLLLLGFGVGSYAVKQRTIQPVHVLKPPVPPVGGTYFDTYLDQQSIVDTKDLNTLHKQVHAFAPIPAKLDTQIVSETFVTTLQEIDTVDSTIHNRDIQLYAPPAPIDQQLLDDAYMTNVDDTTVDDLHTSHKRPLMVKAPSRLEIKNIEQTFITNVDEIDETKVQITDRHNGHRTSSYDDDHYQSTHYNAIDRGQYDTTRDDQSYENRYRSSEEYLRSYQSIVETLEQIMIDETTAKDQIISVDVTSECGARYATNWALREIIERIERTQRNCLYEMLTTDETFKRLVQDASHEPRIRHNLRFDPRFEHRLKPKTWDTFERVLEYTCRVQDDDSDELAERVAGRRDLANDAALYQQQQQHSQWLRHTSNDNNDHNDDERERDQPTTITNWTTSSALNESHNWSDSRQRRNGHSQLSNPTEDDDYRHRRRHRYDDDDHYEHEPSPYDVVTSSAYEQRGEQQNQRTRTYR